MAHASGLSLNCLHARSFLPVLIKRFGRRISVPDHGCVSTLCDLETFITLNVPAKCNAALHRPSIVNGALLHDRSRLLPAHRLVLCLAEPTLPLLDWRLLRFVLAIDDSI